MLLFLKSISAQLALVGVTTVKAPDDGIIAHAPGSRFVRIHMDADASPVAFDAMRAARTAYLDLCAQDAARTSTPPRLRTDHIVGQLAARGVHVKTRAS